MIKKTMWLITVSIVAIAFSVNAFSMMNSNNGYSYHAQRYGYSGSHMSDYDRSLYNRQNYIDPESDYNNNLNGNHNNSRFYDFNKRYRKDNQDPNNDNNFRGKFDRNINSHGDRNGVDHRYQRGLNR